MISVFRRRRNDRRALRVARMLSELETRGAPGRARPLSRRQPERLSLARV